MGHVNNAVYLTYLEQARFTHWRAMALRAKLESAPADGSSPAAIPGFILARAEIDYRRQAKYGDGCEMQLGVAAIGRTSCTYEYEIVDGAGGSSPRAHGHRPLRLRGRAARPDQRRDEAGADVRPR